MCDISVGRFRAEASLPPKALARLREIHHHFDDDLLRDTVVPLITQRNTVSLRALDWLVTNYAKKHHIVFRHRRRDGSVSVTNVYADYKSWLKHFRRRNFDPFRRRQRISFSFNDAAYETTVGQLNFMYWAWWNGILEYARVHIEAIERDMTVCMQTTRQEKVIASSSGCKRKRRELSQGPSCKCFVYRLPITCSFDSAGTKRA